jgi:hypothetical protein
VHLVYYRHTLSTVLFSSLAIAALFSSCSCNQEIGFAVIHRWRQLLIVVGPHRLPIRASAARRLSGVGPHTPN